VDKRRLETGRSSSLDKRGWSLERNWKINCGLEKAGVWKETGRSVVDKRRLEPGKELEDQLWIRGSWSLVRNWKINCE
jgi:hypothetical protein